MRPHGTPCTRTQLSALSKRPRFLGICSMADPDGGSLSLGGSYDAQYYADLAESILPPETTAIDYGQSSGTTHALLHSCCCFFFVVTLHMDIP